MSINKHDPFEDVRESILELLQTDERVQAAVMERIGQRFNIDSIDRVFESADHLDEVICMEQVILYREILNGVLG